MLPARYRATIVLASIFAVAWVVALALSSDDRARSAEDPNRWVQGPPSPSTATAPTPATDDDPEDESDE